MNSNLNYYIYEELILNKLFNEGSYLSTILEQIAFSLYTNRDNKNYIEYVELSNIIQNYNENYPGFYMKVDKLVNNQFLKEIHPMTYKFQSDYMYYYFIGNCILKSIPPEERHNTINNIFKNLYTSVNYNIALFLAYKLNFEYDILPLLKRYSNKEANMLPLISFAINVLNDYSTEIKSKVIYETLELIFDTTSKVIGKDEEFTNAMADTLAASIMNEAIEDIFNCYCKEHHCDFVERVRLKYNTNSTHLTTSFDYKQLSMQVNNKPQWISLCPEESIHVEFLVFTENSEAAFKAVKNSTLPQDVIDYLTEDGTFEGVLTRGGFSVYSNPYFEDTEIEGLSFKEVLGEYNEDFLKIIAPFVPADSYIEIETKDNLLYRWKFDGSTCKKIYQKIVWE